MKQYLELLQHVLDRGVAKGDRVELRGFGAFTVKHRPPRAGDTRRALVVSQT